MHQHALFTLAVGLATLAQPSFALPTSTSASFYARPTSQVYGSSHVDVDSLGRPILRVQGQQGSNTGASPYEGKYQGTSISAEADCSKPQYIQIDRETLQHDYRDLICNGRGHLHRTDPLHLSFTLPAATASSSIRISAGGGHHKSHHVHKHTVAKTRNTQFETCKQSCLTTPTCVSFSFNGWDSVCNLYSVSLKKQGFIDWREQEVDIEVDESAAHAIWTDVVFWDAGCYVRVCGISGDDIDNVDSDDPSDSASSTSNSTKEDAENATADNNNNNNNSHSESEDPEWRLGERVAGFDSPTVAVGYRRAKSVELNL